MSSGHSSAEPLAGGLANAGGVVRMGDRVRRPAPPNAASIHRLLDHVVARGFRAPLPHCIDAEGFEEVGFVPGEVAISPYPEWANTGATLASVGQLLRRYHELVADFAAPHDSSWSSELADPDGGPVMCHNDVCLENVVFQDGRAAALIDFDFVAPGRPEWDVVHTARYWVPVTDPQLAAPSRGTLDIATRLRLLVDAYGLDSRQRARVPEVLLQAEDVAFDFFTRRVERGDPAFVASWDTAAQLRYDQKMTWLRHHLDDLAEALR